MSYVQFLRLRKALTVYGIVVGGLFLIALALGHSPDAVIDFSDGSHREFHATSSLPLSGLLFFAAWCAIIFATAVCTSLNREYDGVEMVWTKPIARERLAVLYIVLDFIAILVAFVFAAALSAIAVASVGGLKHFSVDDRAVPTLVIGLGAAFMWYGLVQGLTAGQRRRGVIIVGVSWGSAFLLLVLAESTRGISPPIHLLSTLLNVFNPLAYFSSYSLSGFGAHASPVLPQALAGTEMRSILTWTIGFLGCVAAVVGWKRLEA
jgi:hypothetical protein